MPRSTSPTLESLLPHCETQSTVDITLRDDTVKYYCTGDEELELTPPGADDPVTYLPDLIRVGELKETLGQPTNRISVKISNVRNDSELGKTISAATRKTELADVVIRRLYRDADDPETFEWKHFFTGKAVSVVAEQEVIEDGELNQTIRPFVAFDVIDDIEAAGTCIATETLSPNNGWKFPDVPDQSPPGSGDNPGGGVGGGELPCFAGETLINISEDILIPFLSIYEQRDVFIGSSIISFDDEGEIVIDVIENVFRHTVEKYLLVEFADGSILRVTKEHPFFTEKGFTAIGKLKTGDKVKSYKQKWRDLEIVSIEEITETIGVFNLTTRRTHHYFADGKGVHNRKDDQL